MMTVKIGGRYVASFLRSLTREITRTEIHDQCAAPHGGPFRFDLAEPFRAGGWNGSGLPSVIGLSGGS